MGARRGDEAPERAKSLRQQVRIGKVTDQERDVDGTQAGAGTLKPQNCGPLGVAQEYVLLAGRPDDNIPGRSVALDRQRGWRTARGALGDPVENWRGLADGPAQRGQGCGVSRVNQRVEPPALAPR